MTKRREESDGLVVPEGGRKAVPTAATRGGKGTTASEEAGQLQLSFETAEIPQGAEGRKEGDQATSTDHAVPKSKATSRTSPPAMTMEEVAEEANLRRAFEEVARNKGAAGPDGLVIDEVREHLEQVL